ncbi:MAG: response regulator, partial [Hydrogenovibrio sp.]|uniref:response regulator n=1 Tax=Hydrogenovibrio sp. TaxID=2065821 RepID=UPI00287086CC
LKRVEQDLEESARQTEAILDNIVDGIIVIDSRGIVQSMNPSAQQIFGYDDQEVKGQNVSMLMPSPHREAHDGYLDHYLEGGEAKIIGIGREVEAMRKDGSIFPMDLAISEVSQQGKTLFVGIVRDISERKRIEKMKNEFVSTVSHELRTPLTSISGALGLIVGGKLGEMPAQAKQMLAIAHKNSQRLSHLINDLLDMEKIAAGKMEFDMQVQRLLPIIQHALESLQTYSTEQQVNIVLDERDVAQAEVQVDSHRLQQVLANLMSNAIKFSPKDGMVRIQVRPAFDKVLVSVTDEGPGIPEAFRDRIFEKFSQADASDTRKQSGTGLGLAITRELVERMQGQIGFESKEGEGTSFWFTLPLTGERKSDIAELQGGNCETRSSRILVVEDEPDVAEVLATLLAKHGYQVDIASTGEQALSCLQSTAYDAMTLDLMLPDIFGLEIINRVRQQSHTADIPIIVVSAKVEAGKLAMKKQLPSIDWLGKPIDENQLLKSLEIYIAAPDQKQRVLHIEDDKDLHMVISSMASEYYDFELATSLSEARKYMAAEPFDVVLLDIGLPDGAGWDLLSEIDNQQPKARVIILSGENVLKEDAAKVEAVLLKSRVSSDEFLETLNHKIKKQLERNANE